MIKSTAVADFEPNILPATIYRHTPTSMLVMSLPHSHQQNTPMHCVVIGFDEAGATPQLAAKQRLRGSIVGAEWSMVNPGNYSVWRGAVTLQQA